MELSIYKKKDFYFMRMARQNQSCLLVRILVILLVFIVPLGRSAYKLQCPRMQPD